MRSLMLSFLAALTLVAPVTAADTTTKFEAAGVEVTVPDGWKSKLDADAFHVDAPGGDMSIVFTLLPSKKQEEAVAAIEKELDKAVGKIAWEEKPTKEKINGMESEIWNGTAKEGKLQVEAIYVETPADKTVGVYWFDTPESEAKYKKQIDVIVKGFKPLAK